MNGVQGHCTNDRKIIPAIGADDDVMEHDISDQCERGEIRRVTGLIDLNVDSISIMFAVEFDFKFSKRIGCAFSDVAIICTEVYCDMSKRTLLQRIYQHNTAPNYKGVSKSWKFIDG